MVTLSLLLSTDEIDFLSGFRKKLGWYVFSVFVSLAYCSKLLTSRVDSQSAMVEFEVALPSLPVLPPRSMGSRDLGVCWRPQ